MDQDVLLDLVLRPNPPMGPRALLVVLGLVACVNLALAAGFVVRGAWPMAPFLGADVALLAWALRTSAAAASREEQVTLTPSSLRIARRPGPEVVLNPYWVRIDADKPPGLTLWSHGKGVRVGTFLGPAERASLAQALRSALGRVR